MDTLVRLVKDSRTTAGQLKSSNEEIAELDRRIEELGFNYGHFGALTRMFIFSKENLQGSDAVELASQMKSIYGDLGRRCQKFAVFYTGA